MAQQLRACSALVEDTGSGPHLTQHPGESTPDLEQHIHLNIILKSKTKEETKHRGCLEYVRRKVIRVIEYSMSGGTRKKDS